MNTHATPEQSEELEKRIRLVRRDVSDLLFHFTRSTNDSPANSVLHAILNEGKLRGTSRWSEPDKIVCFTESPIQEFNSIFSLVTIASSESERPRYEPYGIAVSKKWLYKKGGRPVIYDHPDALCDYPESLRYRYVQYNPASPMEDYTWEREWRIKIDELELDSQHTLVVVPSSKEAFDIVYGYAHVDIEHDWDSEDWDDPTAGYITGSHHIHKPHWLTVSLELFGFKAQ
ncbi:hypothetical protein [Methyloglobulus sp.]|uniref:hypothetical protein n=1 Tax=Methyloglobulus sp. TaxID=2518622 RepID=UPI0032B76A12